VSPRQQLPTRIDAPAELQRRLAETELRLREVNRLRIKRWEYNPVLWARECIAWPEGQGLTTYQEGTLDELVKTGRVAVRSGHGTGKTTTNSMAALWFATTRELAGYDWKVLTTAGAWRQLEKYLWPEIHRWARRIKFEVLGLKPFNSSQLLDLALKLDNGEAFAVAASDPALVEGAHAVCLLYIFDESKAIDARIFDAAEGAFAGSSNKIGTLPEAFGLAQSTPGDPEGRFYDIHAHRPGLEDWSTRHITLKEAIAACRITEDWAEKRKKQWGAQSQLYNNRVLGEFKGSEGNCVIPLAWVEAAQDRYREWVDDGSPIEKYTDLGVDVAREGDDETVLAYKAGHVVTRLEHHNWDDTTITAGWVNAALHAHQGARAVVDTIGVGAGVFDMVRQEHGRRAIPFNASEATDRTDRTGEHRFLNCLTGDARVAPIGQLRRIWRSWHDGPLYRVKTAGGDDFTATPNHNVLTLGGWVPVQALSVGDKLCDASFGQGMSFGQPEIGQVPPTLSEVYGAARMLFEPERMVSGAVNFHGDRPVGEVEVVTVNGQLLYPPGRGQQSSDPQLVWELLGQGDLSSESSPTKTNNVLRDEGRHADWRVPAVRPHGRSSAMLGFGHPLGSQPVGFGVGSEGYTLLAQGTCYDAFGQSESPAQGFGRLTGQVVVNESDRVGYLGTQEQRGLGLIPWTDVVFSQNSPWHVPVDPVTLAQRVQGLARQIPTNDVVSIDVIPASRHGGSYVYTMETSTGAYRSKSTVARNCRAAAWWYLRDLLDPAAGAMLALPDDDLMVGDLTAVRWKISRGGKIQVESKEEIKARIHRSTDSADAVIQACLWEVRRARMTFAGKVGRRANQVVGSAS
jgi:hypothetical protein